MEENKKVYDKNLIDRVVSEFKSKNFKPSDVDIYFDMDNTLALFSIYGLKDQAEKAMYSKGFFKELSIFSEAPYVLENLKNIGFNLYILSSCLDTPFCREEKLGWLNYHLPFIKNENIIFIDNGNNKAEYIKRPKQSILIDDYYVNLSLAYESGIIGIKKSYSGKERPILQISNLIDIFTVLYQLNCLN